MFKIWILADFLGLFAGTFFGQSFGLKGGLNLSNMVFHPDGSRSSRNFDVHTGFHLGIITNITIYPVLQLESDLILSTKGINVKRAKFNGYDPTRGSANLLYLDIPVAMKVFLSKGVGPDLFFWQCPIVASVLAA